MSHRINSLQDATALCQPAEAEDTCTSTDQRLAGAAAEPEDRGGRTPPRQPPENLSPLVTASPAREPWWHHTWPFAIVETRKHSAWDYAMVCRLFRLDGRVPPAYLSAETLRLLDTVFPNRRAAKEALALLEAAVVP